VVRDGRMIPELENDEEEEDEGGNERKERG
jgi:hypothetical protein